MDEQSLVTTSTDPSSIIQLKKEAIPFENLRRSLSNKLNVLAVPLSTPSRATSTTSLAAYCTETNSKSCQHMVTDTIIRPDRTSIAEGRLLSTDVKRPQSLPDVVKGISTDDSSDSDTFDDEEEVIHDESLYSSIPLVPLYAVLQTCPICLDETALYNGSCCTFHCCHRCWKTHIMQTINDGRVKIPCVSIECNKYLERESIVNFIRQDESLHERYFKLYANINQNPRAKTCPRCSHLYSLDSLPMTTSTKKLNKKIPKQVQCPECSLVWCFRCSAPWHENFTCKQFLKGDKLLLKWTKQKNEDQWNARRCPKCSSFIQRAGGCPHMTCSSCSCEFCYLCGRRYVKIPLIGQHSNKFSMFGCPYILHPERPWLRRTIRGTIATGVVVASPVIIAGALVGAVVVLPSLGIYKLVRRARARRHARDAEVFIDFQRNLLHRNHDQPLVEDVNIDEMIERLQQLVRQVNPPEDHFPLSIYADMDVENLFTEDERPTVDFRTCPTTPAVNMNKGISHSLDNLTTINHVTTSENV